VDILARVAARPKPPFCVGFAAETSEVNTNAEAKRRKRKSR
jgi:phosphopantothenoylcysteine decarboxylase/phosphopantothenate--cysteine ligase